MVKQEHGLASIRIGGQRLDELDMVKGAHAKEQLPAFMKTDRENREAAIRARYPRGPIEYFEARIRECEHNIVRIGKMKDDQQTMIVDYAGHIRLCAYRDEQIAKCDPKEDGNVVKMLKRQFPPYDVAALEQQIIQCEEAIERSDGVIVQEFKSIGELREARVRCEQRDVELKQLGA